LAIKIFDLVEKFAGYGFNKSHSAAYAIVSYQTAWLKAHYPAHFMAATMSSDMDKTDKVVTFIEECRTMKLKLLPPDVNSGEFHFTVDDAGRIIYGLGAIKGLGEGPVESIIAARQQGGPFKDLFDFCARVDPRKVNKRALEALIRSGAADSLGPTYNTSKQNIDHDRAVMFAAMVEAVKTAEQAAANTSAGMMDLFGEVIAADTTNMDVYNDFRRVRTWTMKERLNSEKETLGLYLTGHPIDEYENELVHLVSSRIVNLKPEKGNQTISGLIISQRIVKTKRGDNMAIVTLDDRTGRMDITLFSETYNNARDLLLKDGLLVISGQVRYDDYSGMLKMSAENVRLLADVRQERARELCLSLESGSLAANFIRELMEYLDPYRQVEPSQTGCAIVIDYLRSDARARLRLGDQWRVRPEDELLQRLRDNYGTNSVNLVY
jgi:DNA polymerase-3 subunit alpha